MNDFFQKGWDSQNIEDNYWSILGFASEQDFKTASIRKLKRLQNIGFNFNSNLLDVGCGTGTIPYSIFNDMKGKYYGCDISEKGVEYCMRKYQKDNFTFFVNEQTNIGIIDGTQFDFICFYSVFTHCYEDEIIAILKQCKGYLKPDGKIMADFFIGKYDGDNRYISGLSQESFDKIIQESGLELQILSNKPFQDNIQRILTTLSL